MSLKLNSDTIDSEHVILRLPLKVAESLNKDLSDGIKLENKLSLKFSKESRKCVIRYDNKDLKALIVNLPNEACTLKTTNNEVFTNLLNIKHMIMVDENTPAGKYNKEYVLKDGIAPPLKNINILKYRKPKKKQSVKMMEIIKEMLVADSKADSVWYKMIDKSDDEETERRDIAYIQSECERIENEKRIAKESKERLKLIQGELSDENADDSCDSESSSDKSHLSYSGGSDDDDEMSSDDDDFEEY